MDYSPSSFYLHSFHLFLLRAPGARLHLYPLLLVNSFLDTVLLRLETVIDFRHALVYPRLWWWWWAWSWSWWYNLLSDPSIHPSMSLDHDDGGRDIKRTPPYISAATKKGELGAHGNDRVVGGQEKGGRRCHNIRPEGTVGRSVGVVVDGDVCCALQAGGDGCRRRRVRAHPSVCSLYRQQHGFTIVFYEVHSGGHLSSFVFSAACEANTSRFVSRSRGKRLIDRCVPLD